MTTHRSFRRLFFTTFTGWLLIACQIGTTLTPEATIDLAAVKTSAAATAFAELTALAPSATPSITSFPTPSPIPAAIAAILPSQCTPQPGVTVDNFPLQQFLLQQYAGMGCKLPVLSPDGKYLAYVTLTRQEDKLGLYFIDVVRILQVDEAEDKEVYLADKHDYIAALEWSPTGQLIIKKSIWEGPWVIFVYDPVTNAIVSTMRLDTYGKLEWNSTKTALYAEHSFIYGAGNCINELRGYDFEHHRRFPDFYEIYDIKKRTVIRLEYQTEKLTIYSWNRLAGAQTGSGYG